MTLLVASVPLWSLFTAPVLLALVKLVTWMLRNNAAARKRQEDADVEAGVTHERESTARHRIASADRARMDGALERQLNDANERIREKDALIVAQTKVIAAKDYEISMLSSQNGGLAAKAEGHEDCLALVRTQSERITSLSTDVAVAKVDSEHKDALIGWLEERLRALEPEGSIPPPRPKKRSITPADMPAVLKEPKPS